MKNRKLTMNQRTVNRNIRQHWTMLGTAALALMAAGAAPAVAHADSQATSSAAVQSTVAATELTATRANRKQSSAASIVSARPQASSSAATHLSLTATQPTSASSSALSASVFNDVGSNGQQRLGFAVSGSDSTTYHQAVVVSDDNSFKSPYVIEYANSGTTSPILGVKNLVQHRQLSNGVVENQSVNANSYVQFVENAASTASAPALVSDVYGNSSAASNVSILTFAQGPLNSGANNAYGSGSRLWWSYDLILNPKFNTSKYFTNATHIVSAFDQSPTPVKVNFVDESGNAIAAPQWVTGSNIYPGRTFKLRVANPNGYEYTGGWSYVGVKDAKIATVGSGYNTSAHITGVFSNMAGGAITLTYRQSPAVTAQVDFYDATTNQFLTVKTVSKVPGSTWNAQISKVVQHYVNQGYQVQSNATVPADSITISVSDSQNHYQVNLTHKTTVVNLDDKSAPDWLRHIELSKRVSRVVTFVDQKTLKQIAPAQVQTVMYRRTGTYDFVTHKAVSYSAWTTTNKKFESVKLPTISGYQALKGQTVKAATIGKNYTGPRFSVVPVYYQSDSSTKSVAATVAEPALTVSSTPIVNAYTAATKVLPTSVKLQDLERTVPLTVNLVDQDNNQTTITTSAKLYRTAVFENGKLKGYAWGTDSKANLASIVPNAEDAWTATTASVAKAALAKQLGTKYTLKGSWNTTIKSIVNALDNHLFAMVNVTRKGKLPTSSEASSASSAASSAADSSNSSATSSASRAPHRGVNAATGHWISTADGQGAENQPEPLSENLITKSMGKHQSNESRGVLKHSSAMTKPVKAVTAPQQAVADQHQVPLNQSNDHQLPQTGEKQNRWLGVGLGLLSIALAGGLFMAARRKR